MKNYVIILICLSILGIYAYFHPTKEIMSCNEHYECKVTHKYFGFINFHSNLNLSQNSFLSQKITPRCLRKVWYYSSLEYDGKSPFIYYWNHQSKQENLDYFFSIEQKKFGQYLLNPQTKYEINSEAHISILIMYLLLIYVLLGIFLPYIDFSNFKK